MARRARVQKPSRAQGASFAPTPIHSVSTTPCSSAYPSAYPSEDECDTEDAVKYIPIRRLTLQDFGSAKHQKPALPVPVPTKPFPFLDLPSELRLKVYGFHFAGTDAVIDLHRDNYKRVARKLAILRTCRTVYNETSYFFYTTRAFRIFPTQPGRFFKTRRPLLARLKPLQRASITELELRLGPGWSKPPRGWTVDEALGLRDCINVRKLRVFVQLDPSASFLKGFRKADGFYETFSRTLLMGILAHLPHVEQVEFDAWDPVRKGCPIIQDLLHVALQNRKKICWGPERGWSDVTDTIESVETIPATALMDGLGPAIIAVA